MYGTRTEDEDKKGRLKSKECQFYSRNNGGAVKGVRGGGRVIGPPLARETIFSPPFRQLLQNTTEPLSLASCALSRNDRRNMPLSLSLSLRGPVLTAVSGGTISPANQARVAGKLRLSRDGAAAAIGRLHIFPEVSFFA